MTEDIQKCFRFKRIKMKKGTKVLLRQFEAILAKRAKTAK